MRVEGHGDCRTTQPRAYDHSRAVYYAWVRLPDGLEAPVVSRSYNGPYRVVPAGTARRPAEIG